MRGLKTLTYILVPLFIGLIIGAAIAQNTALFFLGIVLLILDAIIGISLQYAIEKADRARADEWNSLSLEEKRKNARKAIEQAKQEMRDNGIDIDGEMDKFCDDFNRDHSLGKYSHSNRSNNSYSSADTQFNFSVGKRYNLVALKKHLTSATGYAQNMFGRMVVDSVKVGMREEIFDPTIKIRDPQSGSDEPFFSYMFKTIAKARINEYPGQNKIIKPVSKISFGTNPKSCTLEFNYTQIGESKEIIYWFSPPNNIYFASALKIGPDRYALLTIFPDDTFVVESIIDENGSTASEEKQDLYCHDTQSEYGMSIDFPICLSSVNEEYIYIDLLKCASKDEVIISATRLGSIYHKGVNIDEWKITVKNTRYNTREDVIIYMNAYSKDCNFTKTPRRFTM